MNYKSSSRRSNRPEIQMSRVQRALKQLPSAEAAESLITPRYSVRLGIKIREIRTYNRWISFNLQPGIFAYSDGSSEDHSRSSWGFALQRAGTTFNLDKGSLHGSEIYDAEIMGTLRKH